MFNEKKRVKLSAALAAALVFAAGVPVRGQERNLEFMPPVSAERFVMAAAPADAPAAPAVSSTSGEWTTGKKWLVGGLVAAAVVAVVIVAANSGGGGGGY